jgi:hypothetical protein
MKLAEDPGHQLGSAGYRQLFMLSQGTRVPMTLLLIGSAGGPFWAIKGGSNVSSDWEVDAVDAPRHIPVANTWFKLEVFWHPSEGTDGRVWVAMDGEKILDRQGKNLTAPGALDNVQFFVDGTPQTPSEQWVDDLEIWDGVPDGAASR